MMLTMTSLGRLILAPTFFSAAIYSMLGMLITVRGRHYSRLTPAQYLGVFIVADVVSLVVQAVGGALAALALESGKDSQTGTHIMLGGIVLQLGFMIIFCLLAIDFLISARRGRKTELERTSTWKMELGLAAGSIAILVRCVYRSFELAEGWTGFLITHEGYFM